ncbi:MAG: PadR family transcriptional regulator [Acidimicrobiales bacterium]
MEPEPRRSPLSLAVLGLLAGGPLHPYRIQQLLKEWGKDAVINVGQRSNLYKAIKRLNDAGFIAVKQTERDQQYPERTVYEITKSGWSTTVDWLNEMIDSPKNEFPEFPAALSFLMLLGPKAAKAALERRKEKLKAKLDELDRELNQYLDSLPRVVLMETEYLRAVVAAEITWLQSVISDLKSGSLTWSKDDMVSAVDAYKLD